MSPFEPTHQLPPDENSSPRRRGRGGIRVAFSVLVFLLLLVSLEGLCRVLGLGSRQEVAHYVSDWLGRTDGKFFWVIRGAGYNQEGFRDRDHPIEKPEGTFRLLCLGDSVTNGHGVPETANYPFLLNAILEQAGVQAEVFNMAIPGWSTLQQRIAYEEIGRKYKPDQVLLGFCLNDVAEMNNNLQAPPSGFFSQLHHRSALFRAIVRADERQVHSVEEMLTKPDAPAVKQGWERVFHEIDLMHAIAQQDGAQLSIVIFPFRFQLATDAPPPVAQQTLMEYCQTRGIPCIDVLPVLQTVGTEAFIDESHLSREGAWAVAKAILAWQAGQAIHDE